MKNNFKKWFQISALAVPAMTFVSLSMANAPVSTTPASPAGSGSSGAGDASVVAAINDLNHNIEKLAVAKSQATNQSNYEVDPNQSNVMSINGTKDQVQIAEFPNKTGITAITNSLGTSLSNNNITNALSQFSDQTLTYSTPTDDVLKAQARMKARDALTNKLSWETKASDSLYSDLLDAPTDIQKPTDLHNNYFDFSSLITPKGYTEDQQKAAQKFLTYLSNSYQSLSSGINYSKLKNYLMTLQDNPTKLEQTLKSFATSDTYENFQLQMRSMLSSRSVAMNNFHQLMAERMPIVTAKANPMLAQISNAIGVTPTEVKIKNSNDVRYVYASPLQISNYVTTHRTNSSAWYQQMASASPATLQREQVYILAEIESQLQQQHLDSERVLATLSTMELQNSSMQKGFLQTAANDINNQIDSLTQDSSKSSIAPINSSNNNQNLPTGFGNGNNGNNPNIPNGYGNNGNNAGNNSGNNPGNNSGK